MKEALLLAAALSLPVAALSGPCAAPHWESGVAGISAPVAQVVQVEMQPLARVSIAAGFNKVSVSPDGSVAFHEYDQGGASVLLLFETRQTAERHQRRTPHALFSAIFTGADKAGCKYLAEGFQLDKEDYRLHIARSPHVSIYAWGTGTQHKFYLLDRRQPDFVLVGSFKNASRQEVEGMLSTITTK